MMGNRDTRGEIESRAERTKQEEGKRKDEFSSLCLRDNNR